MQLRSQLAQQLIEAVADASLFADERAHTIDQLDESCIVRDLRAQFPEQHLFDEHFARPLAIPRAHCPHARLERSL